MTPYLLLYEYWFSICNLGHVASATMYWLSETSDGTTLTMATKLFGGLSPYNVPPSHPEEDFLHTEYLANMATKCTDKGDRPPVAMALFGVGSVGCLHLANLLGSRRVALRYIVDDQPQRFHDFRSYWKLPDDIFLITSKDADRVYNDNEVKVVVVASPTFTHQSIVIKSINAGKHVFCEKPIAQNLEDVKECFEVAKAKGRYLYCGFNRHFDPAYRSLKNRVRRGEVGHVQILKVTARDSPLPPIGYLKGSGGFCHDSMVHDFDMACWILGELPIRVQASASSFIPEIQAIDDFDTVAYILTFPSGSVVIGDNSRFSAYGYDQRLEVFGNKGMIKVENERPMHSLESYNGLEGVRHTPIYYNFNSRFRLSYKYEMEHFLDVVQDGVPMDVNSWQCVAGSKIATAVERSARSHQTVELDWGGDHIPEVYS